ncbi:hypothetical protein TrRE_jg5529, partial [Triparma retinervis]
MGRPIVTDGNMRLDIFIAYPMGTGYANYWNFGIDKSMIAGTSIAEDVSNVNSWAHYVHTYDRSLDLATYYIDGDFVANGTNGFANETWATSSNAQDFGYFGKTNDTSAKGIEAWSIGCRSGTDSDYVNLRGGLDDFAVYNGVLDASEVKAIYDDVNAFDPSADDRLALYYSFNDPLSNTVINEAPLNSGKYPLILGVDRVLAVTMAEPGYSENTCTVKSHIAPVFVCHVGETCSDISDPSNAPLAMAPLPAVTCPRDGSVTFPFLPFAYDPDGQGLSYRVMQLPEHGDLYEENQRLRLPDSMGKSIKIESSSLPYEQTEIVSPYFRFLHNPTDPYDIQESDSFVVEYSDGTNTVEVTIAVDIAIFNKSPIISPGSTATTSFSPKEDTSITHTLAFTDYDSSLVTVMVEEVPVNGVLTYNSGDETIALTKFSPFNPYGDQVPMSQYATSVVAFSSHWSNEANNWGATQILGEPSTPIYADSEMAWAPATKEGIGISKNEADEPGRELEWDPAANLAEHGFTEYIEVQFNNTVFLSDIEVGIVRGCGCIVRMVAKNSENDNEMVIYNEKPDLSCDAEDGLARLTNTISRFSPPSLCNTPFAMDRIRIEIDTTTIVDWNELDYIKVTGYENIPSGVLPPGVTEVEYKPDANFFGQDMFSFRSTDCGYHGDTVSELAEVVVDVEGVKDAPIVQTILLDASPDNATHTIDVGAVVTNLDDSELTVEFPVLPSIGSLRVHGTGEAVMGGEKYDLASTTFDYTVSNFPEVDTNVIVKYKVHDESQDLESEENIKIVVQGVPVEGMSKEIIGGIVGAAVFIIAGLTLYFTKMANSLKKERIEDLRRLDTMRKENVELHKNLKMLQKYGNDELDMIEAQITTFRKDFSKKKTSQDGNANNLSVGKDIEKLLIVAKELESEFVIGKGSFGEVHKSKYRGTSVAVKTLHEIDKESLERFQAEILLMADLHHTNVVQLVGACWEKDLMALVMEFCEKGMSSEVLEMEGVNFSWDDPLLKWCMDTGRAMRYLHGVTYVDVKTDRLVSGVIHRDLKPDNCLVTDTYTLKVADFGEARAFNENNTMTQVGTPLYIAPEIVRGDHYSTQADVFSFALTILAWSIKGREPFLDFLFRKMMADRNKGKPGKPGAQQVSLGKVSHSIINKGWRPRRSILKEIGMPDCIADLLTICWLDSPNDRPSFSEIMDYLETEAMDQILPGQVDLTGQVDASTGRTRRSSVTGALKNKITKHKLDASGTLRGEAEDKAKIDSMLRTMMELLKGGGGVERDQMELTKLVVESCAITNFGRGEGGGGEGYLEGVGGDELVDMIRVDEAKEEDMIKGLNVILK